jgi:hypothetical protein
MIECPAPECRNPSSSRALIVVGFRQPIISLEAVS